MLQNGFEFSQAMLLFAKCTQQINLTNNYPLQYLMRQYSPFRNQSVGSLPNFSMQSQPPVFQTVPTSQVAPPQSIQQKQPQSQISNPEGQIRQLQEELSKVKQQNRILEQNYNASLSQNDQVTQVEKRLGVLITENKQVNNFLADKMAEYDKLRGQNADYVVELNRLRGLEHELNLTKDMAELRSKESEKQRTRSNQLDAENRQLQQTITEQNSKCKILIQEVSQWKMRFTELDQERLRQLEQTRYTLQTLKQQESEQIQQSYDEQLKQLERNLEVLANEYDKVMTQQKQKCEELDQYKIKVMIFHQIKQQYSKLEVKYNTDCQRLETEVQNLRNEKLDYEKLQQHTDKAKDENSQQTQYFTIEIERLNGIVNNRNDEIEKFRKLLEQTAQQILIFQDKNKLNFNNIERELARENKKLRKDNEKFIQEVEHMRRSVQSFQSVQSQALRPDQFQQDLQQQR